MIGNQKLSISVPSKNTGLQRETSPDIPSESGFSPNANSMHSIMMEEKAKRIYLTSQMRP